MGLEKGQYLYLTVDMQTDSNTSQEITFCKIGIDSNLYMDNYDQVINIKHHDYTPQIGDKLYFMPGVNIPRIKLKDLAINYNTKTVRDPLEANVIFAGTNTAAKITDTAWEYSIPTDLFKQFFDAAQEHLDEHDKEKVKTALEFYDKPIILTNWDTCNKLSYEHLNIYRNLIINIGVAIREMRESHRVYKINAEDFSLYNKVKDIELYSETALLDKINGKDSVVINSEVYDQLEAMLKSSDEDNHTMAMEIMANCNYRESLLYLEFLFKEYSYKFADCSAKNHVNFKSLLAYLGKDKTSMGTSIDEIMNSLINKNVLTEDKVEEILKRYSYEISQYGNKKYFKVKSITLQQETLALLNANYVHETVQDFIPVEVEIIETPVEQQEEVKWT
jgi:hypothetical protein